MEEAVKVEAVGRQEAAAEAMASSKGIHLQT
jgi:hypothetical protein